ncbi:hypothetical protein BS78_04G068200 [Paspalum vaginatum]|nr:hypothetical protein BS78_04G068200 [Paspalum vaginatum]
MRGSPMRPTSASSSAGSGRQEPRLIDCPKCGIPLIKIKSKKEETFGEVFIKCPNNMQGDPTTCGFIRSEAQYAAYISSLEHRRKKGGNLDVVDEMQCYVDEDNVLKQQLCEFQHQFVEFKHQFDSVVGEMWRLKVQVLEMNQQLAGKKDRAGVVVAVCVGVVLGIVVSNLWK